MATSLGQWWSDPKRARARRCRRLRHPIAADLQSVGKTPKADAPVLLAIDEA
jgi:hypothetical protein